MLAFNVACEVLEIQRDEKEFTKDGKTERYTSVVLNCRTLEKPRQTFVARPSFGLDVPAVIVADVKVNMAINDLRTEKNITTARFTSVDLKA